MIVLTLSRITICQGFLAPTTVLFISSGRLTLCFPSAIPATLNMIYSISPASLKAFLHSLVWDWLRNPLTLEFANARSRSFLTGFLLNHRISNGMALIYPSYLFWFGKCLPCLLLASPCLLHCYKWAGNLETNKFDSHLEVNLKSYGIENRKQNQADYLNTTRLVFSKA